MQSRSALAAIVLSVAIILLAAVRFLVPGVWATALSPLWKAGSSLTASVGGAVTLESKAQLAKERDTDASRVTALTAQNAALSTQVADLTKLLGTRTAPAAGIVAGVRARPPVAPYDVLIIDQGTQEGVAIGALVLGDGGTPLGTIGQADPDQSRVTLFSTHGIQSSGWVGSARIPVTLTGEGAGAFSVTVPKTAGVTVGSGVYLAQSGAYPVGTVVKIEEDPSSPSVNLDVHPYVNPFSVTWVTVERQ